MRVDLIPVPDGASLTSTNASVNSGGGDKSSFAETLARSTLAGGNPATQKPSTVGSSAASVRSDVVSRPKPAATKNSNVADNKTSGAILKPPSKTSGSNQVAGAGASPRAVSKISSGLNTKNLAEPGANENIREATQNEGIPGSKSAATVGNPGNVGKPANAGKTSTARGTRPAAQATVNSATASALIANALIALPTASIDPPPITLVLQTPILAEPALSAPVSPMPVLPNPVLPVSVSSTSTPVLTTPVSSALAPVLPSLLLAIPASFPAAIEGSEAPLALTPNVAPGPSDLPVTSTAPIAPLTSTRIQAPALYTAEPIDVSLPSKNSAFENKSAGVESADLQRNLSNAISLNPPSGSDSRASDTSPNLATTSTSPGRDNSTVEVPSTDSSLVVNSVHVSGPPPSLPTSDSSSAIPSLSAPSALDTVRQPIQAAAVSIPDGNTIPFEASGTGTGTPPGSPDLLSSAAANNVLSVPSEPAPVASTASSAPAPSPISASLLIDMPGVAPRSPSPSSAVSVDHGKAAQPVESKVASNSGSSGGRNPLPMVKPTNAKAESPSISGSQSSEATPKTTAQLAPMGDVGFKTDKPAVPSGRTLVADSAPAQTNNTATSQPVSDPTAIVQTVASTPDAASNSPLVAGSPTWTGAAEYTGDLNLPASELASSDNFAPTGSNQFPLNTLKPFPSGPSLESPKSSISGSSFPADPAQTKDTVDASISALVPASPAMGASDAPALEKSSSPPAAPPAHQILDAAPVPPTIDSTSGTSSLHMSTDPSTLQMHMGVRTSAFGNVEIHTVIDQNQVGVAVHGDRDLARWFNSEVGGLETGLKSQHLNLTTVSFNSDRSGVQTATSFQQGQPRHNSSQSAGANPVVLSSDADDPEPTTETVPGLGVELPETRVSILV